MIFIKVVAVLCLALIVLASVGDRLVEYQNCVSDCALLLSCASIEQTKTVSVRKSVEKEKIIKNKRLKIGKFSIGKSHGKTSSYTKDDFLNRHRISSVPKVIFSWDCLLDCKYKCTQLVTEEREKEGLPVVQFNGKWPFRRIFGITEIMLCLFSIGNWYATWINLGKIRRQYSSNLRTSSSCATIYLQYLYLICGSLAGWLFSVIFHTRDYPWTETLDYLGAAAIIMLNFNSIVVRYFGIFESSKSKQRRVFQFCLIFAYLTHCFKLYRSWDYVYNVYFNMFFGLFTIILWTLHSLRVNKLYKAYSVRINNSIQLLPYENKLFMKLSVVSLAKTKYIPLLPIFLNLWILFGMSFELFDFPPFLKLVDAHCLWHLFTILPSLIWYDWNIWDVELMKLNLDLNKFL